MAIMRIRTDLRQINGAAVDLVKAGASADKVVDALGNGKKQ